MNSAAWRPWPPSSVVLWPCHCEGDSVDTVVDYDFDATHTTLSGTDLWNTSTGDLSGISAHGNA